MKPQNSSTPRRKSKTSMCLSNLFRRKSNRKSNQKKDLINEMKGNNKYYNLGIKWFTHKETKQVYIGDWYIVNQNKNPNVKLASKANSQFNQLRSGSSTTHLPRCFSSRDSSGSGAQAWAHGSAMASAARIRICRDLLSWSPGRSSGRATAHSEAGSCQRSTREWNFAPRATRFSICQTRKEYLPGNARWLWMRSMTSTGLPLLT